MVNNPVAIDSSLQKLVETFNAELESDEQDKRIVLSRRASADGCGAR